MNTPSNRNRLGRIATFFLVVVCCVIKAQKTPEPFKIDIVDPVVIQDTGKANVNKLRLFFKIQISSASDLKSVHPVLSDKDGNSSIDATEYYIKKHESGFYYAENNAREKLTVFGNEIHFFKTLTVGELKNISVIKVDYKTISDKIGTVSAIISN